MSRHDLFDKGSPLITCIRLNKSEVKILLYHILKNTIDYVDANKTLSVLEIKEFLYKQISDRSYIMDEVIDRRKEYEVNNVDYEAHKKWRKENPPKKKRDDRDFNNYKAHRNLCKSIAYKFYAGVQLQDKAEQTFYNKNKAQIDTLRIKLNDRKK